MNKEVGEILRVIEKSPINRSQSLFSDFKHEKTLLILGSLTLVSTVVLFTLGMQFGGVLLGIVFVFILLIYSLIQVLYFYGIFRSPLNGYAVRAENRLQARIQFIGELAKFPPESLLLVSQFFERDAKRIKGRLQTLLGAFEKAGFIPAALALYFASTKIGSGDSALFANVLVSFVLGLYLGAFLVNRVAESLLFNLECLGEAREISEQNYSREGKGAVDTS
ncbi:hypothetical protein [Gilvimarinus chinensis]|uniref:hypothetical protein n=1 Tax=Gilvimarinus chinensis TaxID=396005 RepID=UPI00037983AB|nr:hypothetical protein [Gilvimarinus chinensis]